MHNLVAFLLGVVAGVLAITVWGGFFMLQKVAGVVGALIAA